MAGGGFRQPTVKWVVESKILFHFPFSFSFFIGHFLDPIRGTFLDVRDRLLADEGGSRTLNWQNRPKTLTNEKWKINPS